MNCLIKLLIFQTVFTITFSPLAVCIFDTHSYFCARILVQILKRGSSLLDYFFFNLPNHKHAEILLLGMSCHILGTKHQWDFRRQGNMKHETTVKQGKAEKLKHFQIQFS